MQHNEPHHEQVHSDSTKRWYIVQVTAGFEKRVKSSIEERIALHKMQSMFGRILVPTEEVVERKKGGQERKTERKFFPGYVVIEMEMTDDTWHLVRKTPKVSGFIGATNDNKKKFVLPTALSNKDVEKLLEQVEQGADKPKPKIMFEPGQVVRVIDGPFKDFTGEVKDVDYVKSTLKVGVLIFGRETPVDLEFTQVEKS
jgi:transcriptional antiterminator NusG